MLLALSFFVGCSDKGTSANDEDSSSSISSEIEKPDSSNSSSSVKGSSSSTAKYVCEIYNLSDALRCDCDESREGKLSYNYDSNVELVCIYDEYLNKWGWIVKKDDSSSSNAENSSSSGVLSSSSTEGSSSSAKSSSSTAKSSSSVLNGSFSSSFDENAPCQSGSTHVETIDDVMYGWICRNSKWDFYGSEKIESSSSVAKNSSSSGYTPFDHSDTFNGSLWWSGAYKTFTDSRNGRCYYYLTITGENTSKEADTVTVMAENLNIGEMVQGADDQKNDNLIERYCYDNDTTKCDRYGGLYQWAEMMQLPFECNSKSCADKIQPNHQGICPDGWRLLTAEDFYIILHADGNNHGIEGLRSTYGFGGYNTTGYSLIGAGIREPEGFRSIGAASSSTF